MNPSDPVDDTQNWQLLVSTARLLSGPRAKAGASSSTEAVFSFVLFTFYFLLFCFLLFSTSTLRFCSVLRCCTFPSTALLRARQFYVASNCPSGATFSDQAVIRRQARTPRPYRNDLLLPLSDNSHSRIRLAEPIQRFSSQSLSQSSRRRS